MARKNNSTVATINNSTKEENKMKARVFVGNTERTAQVFNESPEFMQPGMSVTGYATTIIIKEAKSGNSDNLFLIINGTTMVRFTVNSYLLTGLKKVMFKDSADFNGFIRKLNSMETAQDQNKALADEIATRAPKFTISAYQNGKYVNYKLF